MTDHDIVSGAAENLGDCPGCGLLLGVERGPGGEVNGVLHTMPMCERFESMEAGAFLVWLMDVRDAERRGGGGDA